MKKIVSLLMAIFILTALCSCGNDQPTTQPDNKQESTSAAEGTDKVDELKNENPKTKELFGYKYSFPNEVAVSGSADGGIFKCNDCSIFAFNLDVIDFSSWDTIVDDSQEKLFSAVYSAFRFYPNSQSVTTNNKLTNTNGEELLLTEGTFDTSDGDKEFISYYHVTNANKVRFFISIVDGNKENVESVTEYVAKNLAKA